MVVTNDWELSQDTSYYVTDCGDVYNFIHFPPVITLIIPI